jgi:hypothetical protein
MQKNEEKKRKRKIRRLRRIASIFAALILLSITVEGYYRIYYAKIDAQVIAYENKVVGVYGGKFGVHPIFQQHIKVRYSTPDGWVYESELSVQGQSGLCVGSRIDVYYKKSNPAKCFLD